MTRSDDPFGDLPEWKERQRLHEAQERAGGQPVGYQQPNPFGHAPAPQQMQAQDHGGGVQHGDAGMLHHTPDANPYYAQQPAPGAQPLHYNVSGDSNSIDPNSYEPQLQTPLPYEPQGLGAHLPGDPSQSYAPAGQAPLDYRHSPVASQVEVGFGTNDGAYDDNGQYHGATMAGQANAAAGLRPGFDANPMAMEQANLGRDGEPAFYDPTVARGGEHWHGGQVGAAGPQQQSEYDDEYGEEDDYYDDDIEDDTPRYSWKLLAAVVVTGAVVTGGGVVLYDSLMGGGSGVNGRAPIIRAEQAPAKTAPTNAGGRQFGNRDSKLLGRLDNAKGTKVVGAVDEANGSGSRVRSVPTVRIGRDGRLILPKAPEAVTAPDSGDKQVAAIATDQGRAPGINVVDSLGGGGTTGLGSVQPQGVPQAATPQAAPARPAAPTPNVTASAGGQPEAAKVQALRNQPVVPATRASGATNRAITPNAGPPPVPAKSSLGSAWRSTSANVAATAPSNTGAIRPTIAQPVQWQEKTAARAPSQAAPKLGASNVTPTQNRKFVAVLATAPTRMKALQSFAELQQKHPNALLNRVPDVQRADLTARGLGIMYRVVVGPAGSRTSANSVCNSLKSEGYSGCWVKNN